jgi:hypothetical protein
MQGGLKMPSRKIAHAAMAVLIASLASMSATAGPAIVDEGNLLIPFSSTVAVSCANNGVGENVLVQGFVHLRYVLVQNGNRYTYTENANPQGITGTGVVTGDVYRGTGKTFTSYSGDIADDMSMQGTVVDRFHFVGPGPGNDFYLKMTEHFTISANGEITSEFEFGGTTCK